MGEEGRVSNLNKKIFLSSCNGIALFQIGRVRATGHFCPSLNVPRTGGGSISIRIFRERVRALI